MNSEQRANRIGWNVFIVILIGMVVLYYGIQYYEATRWKRQQARSEAMHQQHMAEWEAKKAAWAKMTPEERFEETVFDLDDKDIVHSVTYDDTKIYINCGPLDATADMTQAKAAAQSALSVYAMCARDEGLDQQVCIVGIDKYLLPLWEVAYDASSSVYNAPWETECVVDGCPRTKVKGTAYCPVHQPGGLRNYIESLPGDHEILHQTSKKREPERVIDDVDIEAFYIDNMDEFDDFEDAEDYMEDNPDEWEDY